MTSKWRWLLLQIGRKLWLRTSLFAIGAVITALMAIVLEPYVPEPLLGSIGTEAVDHILDILASSMLAVTTFSFSVVVAAYGAATTNVTPRATRLLMADRTTMNVLGTFIGSFLFSLVGIVALSTQAYGEGGRVVMFGVTLAVIAIIVVTLLRWIDHLSRLGRVGETTKQVELVAAKAIAERVANPCLGASPLRDPERERLAGARPIFAKRIGYVQHVDVGALEDCAAGGAGPVDVAALPGSFVHHALPLAWVHPALPVETDEAIVAAFTIDAERSFDQDPRFGVSVLAEIASRALSPAVNDPGTAIDVIGRIVRLLSAWGARPAAAPDEPIFPSVRVPAIRTADLFDDAFTPIARDGAGIVEVHLRLQKAMLALAVLGDDMRDNSQRHSRLAVRRAEAAMALPEDVALVRATAAPFA